ncbi:MAG TPA: HNH endonuclease [Gammaproteobacteria bacterium]|nr:HNH endonuclease [Gammaproteobacteria bacterium]
MMLSQQVLRTDASGMPLEWIGYQEAVRLYHLGQVAYACGSLLYRLHGGINAATGRRSVTEVNSIVATHGNNHALSLSRKDYIPPVNNHALFRRDAHLCLYCGEVFQARDLSRDHVTPLCQGGQDVWTNLVTACKRCNNHKANRTPEQAGMQLLAVPFKPTHAEYIYLKGKRVLADQMEFLRAHFPRKSPLHERLSHLA